jgi:hypothetical protein
MSQDLIDSGPLVVGGPLVHRGYRYEHAGKNNLSRSWRWAQCMPDGATQVGTRGCRDVDEPPTCVWCVAERMQR